jgi:hypothetical protein
MDELASYLEAADSAYREVSFAATVLQAEETARPERRAPAAVQLPGLGQAPPCRLSAARAAHHNRRQPRASASGITSSGTQASFPPWFLFLRPRVRARTTKPGSGVPPRAYRRATADAPGQIYPPRPEGPGIRHSHADQPVRRRASCP